MNTASPPDAVTVLEVRDKWSKSGEGARKRNWETSRRSPDSSANMSAALWVGKAMRSVVGRGHIKSEIKPPLEVWGTPNRRRASAVPRVHRRLRPREYSRFQQFKNWQL